jgi:2-polyprenyl-6-methoxyphenol hydroxylase-like FAD-dependent oxidoreductase
VVDDQGASHSADLVVGADGRRSTVARLVRAAALEGAPAARAMYYRYVTGWRSPDPVGPEFALDGDDFLYVFPSDRGVACLAVSVPVGEHGRAGGNPGQRLEHAFRANPRTGDRMAQVERVSGVFVGRPADSVWRQAAGPGWALVGDAGTGQDPWAGLGMGTAGRGRGAVVQHLPTQLGTGVRAPSARADPRGVRDDDAPRARPPTTRRLARRRRL